MNSTIKYRPIDLSPRDAAALVTNAAWLRPVVGYHDDTREAVAAMTAGGGWTQVFGIFEDDACAGLVTARQAPGRKVPHVVVTIMAAVACKRQPELIEVAAEHLETITRRRFDRGWLVGDVVLPFAKFIEQVGWLPTQTRSNIRGRYLAPIA